MRHQGCSPCKDAQKNQDLMAEFTGIEWCDHTKNLWWGCTRVHQGCDFCYAAKEANRFQGDIWGNGSPRILTMSRYQKWSKWSKQHEELGRNVRVFVGSMMDIFEKPMPALNWYKQPEPGEETTEASRDRLFLEIVPKYPTIDFLLLTKRPSNIPKYIPQNWRQNPPKNVLFGASVVDKQSMISVNRHFNSIYGKRFLSIEPLLEEVSLENWKGPLPDWVIVGGESGPNRRPFNPDWARKLRDECAMLGIPFFMKQIDKKIPVPEDLMIRQFYS